MLRVHLFTPKSHTDASKFAPSTFIRPKPPPKKHHFPDTQDFPQVSFSSENWQKGGGARGGLFKNIILNNIIVARSCSTYM